MRQVRRSLAVVPQTVPIVIFRRYEVFISTDKCNITLKQNYQRQRINNRVSYWKLEVPANTHRMKAHKSLLYLSPSAAVLCPFRLPVPTVPTARGPISSRWELGYTERRRELGGTVYLQAHRPSAICGQPGKLARRITVFYPRSIHL